MMPTRVAIRVHDVEGPDRVQPVGLIVETVAAILSGQQRLIVGKREVVERGNEDDDADRRDTFHILPR